MIDKVDGLPPTIPGTVPAPPAPPTTVVIVEAPVVPSAPLSIAGPTPDVPVATVPFVNTCVPGTWLLTDKAFSAYIAHPATGSATLVVDRQGRYRFDGKFTVRIDVGSDSIFVYDAAIAHDGLISQTTNGFTVSPGSRPSIEIVGQRAEGAGPAPEGVFALEPDPTGFMVTNTLSCGETFLLATMATPDRSAQKAPATLQFMRG